MVFHVFQNYNYVKIIMEIKKNVLYILEKMENAKDKKKLKNHNPNVH